MVKNNPLLE